MSVADKETQIDELVNWFRNNGGWLNPEVQVVHEHSRGFHMRAKTRLTSPVTIAECPLNLTLSWLNLDPGDGRVLHVSSKLQRCLGKLPDHVLTYLLLIEQLVVEDSPWQHYIECLPEQDELTTPLWADAGDRRPLDGTPLTQAVRDRKTELCSEYEHARAMMAEVGMEGSETYNECDFHAFLWAATIMSSRSFSSKYLVPEKDAFPILLPVVDIANHSVTAKVRWELNKPETFTLSSNHDIDAGAEVCNNYGPKQNGELLLGYGFVIPDNPVEQVAIKVPLAVDAFNGISPEQVPFGMDTSFLTEKVQNEALYLRTPGHIFGRYQNSIPFLQGFPPTVVFMAYLDALRVRGIDVLKFKLSFGEGRLVIATLLSLHHAIRARCTSIAYPHTTTFRNEKQKYASIYRQGQAKIWDTIRRELEAVLVKLRYSGPTKTGAPYVVTWREALVLTTAHCPGYRSSFERWIDILSLDPPTCAEEEEKVWALLLLLIYAMDSNSEWLWDLFVLYPFSSGFVEDDIRLKELYQYLDVLTAISSDLVEVFLEVMRLVKNKVYLWALKVVNCELFHIPDTERRRYMYMRPGRCDERWMVEEVDPTES